ncbi:hypothetical protein [Streptosporangium sandarakinum]
MTVSPQDAFFIEYHRKEKGARSRSAVIREALRLPREATLAEERAAALPERLSAPRPPREATLSEERAAAFPGYLPALCPPRQAALAEERAALPERLPLRLPRRAAPGGAG